MLSAGGLCAGLRTARADDSDAARSTAALRFDIVADYRPDLSRKQRTRLTDAVLDFLVDFHPPGTEIAFWDRNPRDLPFLDKHIHAVVRAVFDGIEANLPGQTLDPLLLLALLYNESRFMPTALAPSGALGMAQFMPDTAIEYGLQPIAHADLWQYYRQVRGEQRRERAAAIESFRRRYKLRGFSPDQVIARALESGNLEILEDYRAIAALPGPGQTARREYIDAVRASLGEHDFFAGGGRALTAIDARCGYPAIEAAATYLCRRLAENNGLATSAVAAYNAGPGAIRDPNQRSVLFDYGAIPAYEETVRFVQRVVVVFTELDKRLRH